MEDLSADKPISDPRDDRLGYAPFAKHLAESLIRMAPPEGFVVAIYGPWGSGKTTVLQFVDYFLRQGSKDGQPIMVHFNPWWFSGHEDLTRRFFDQLQASLTGKLKSTSKELRKHIADFAELVSDVPVPYAALGKTVSQAVRPKIKDVPELKSQIATLLKEQKRRILVIIDDIDRLTSEEIRQLFRVIKAVADFPNIIYLLAFDKEVAIHALEESQGIPGEAYLEKIVQVPLELPLPDKSKLEDLLLGRLNVLLAHTPRALFDQNYWNNVYFEGIQPFISTPRDVVRIVNTLAVTYPAVKGEVNPVDFVAIEVLRVFCPAIYDIIRRNPSDFARPAEMMGISITHDLKLWYDTLLDLAPGDRKSTIKRLLGRLFPRVGTVWGGSIYGADWDGEWRKQLFVRSPDIFPTYFRLSVPEDNLSHTEMQALLMLAGDAAAFGSKLVELSSKRHPNGTNRIRALLDRLQDYTQRDIPLENIPSVVQALFAVGDILLSSAEQKLGMFDLGNDVRLGRIIYQLLQRLGEPTRFTVLQDAMSKGRAVDTIVMEVEVLGQQHGKYGASADKLESDRLVNSEQLSVLEGLALQKIRYAANNKTLLFAPQLPGLLHRYRDWASEGEVKQWVQKVTEDDEKLVIFLEQFLQTLYRQAFSDVAAQSQYSLDPQWLEPFTEPSYIVTRLESLNNVDKLTEKQRIAIEQFSHEYELRQQGNDPNNVLI